jgi:hypothetical protein
MPGTDREREYEQDWENAQERPRDRFASHRKERSRRADFLS